MRLKFDGNEIKIYDFNALESFRIARKIEKEGIALYNKLKEAIPENGVRKVVDALLEEEKSHVEVFEREVEARGGISDDEESLVDVLDSKVVSPLYETEGLDKVLCDRTEAIRLGLAVEHRAIAFYRSILENTGIEEGREALEKIIAEETKHAERLEALM